MDGPAGRGRQLALDNSSGHFLVHSYALIAYFLAAAEKVSPTLHLSRARARSRTQ
jgi:hypothetical protein